MNGSRFVKVLIVFMSVSLAAKEESYIVYAQEEMDLHKQKCFAEMINNPVNLQDPSYQMQRAIKTISGTDTDLIPKIVNAGQIVNTVTDVYQLMHNGIKIIVNGYYDAKWLTDVIYGLKGHHEPQEEKCFYEILKYIPEQATMIELGSYWAYYSLWFASEVEGAKNYLIEPDPKRLEVGMKNFDLNGRIGNFRRGFVGIMNDDADFNGAECISMDAYIAKENIDHIHILHADIQGAELVMLTSMVKSLDKIDYFFISTHDPQEHHYPCLQFFRDHGMVILAEHSTHESCGGDGLIVARRPNVSGPDHIAIRKY